MWQPKRFYTIYTPHIERYESLANFYFTDTTDPVILLGSFIGDSSSDLQPPHKIQYQCSLVKQVLLLLFTMLNVLPQDIRRVKSGCSTLVKFSMLL